MQDTQEKFEGVEDVKAVVDDYQSLSNSQIKTERLGGLSNQIWKVSAKGRKTLIYRKFGEGSGLCDRERENYILQELSERGIAPKYYGGDEEYRIEKFCKGEELTPSVLHDKPLRRRVAKLLAELHSIDFEKLDKSPSFLRLFKDGTFIKEFQDKAKQEEIFTPMERKIVKDIETLTTEEEIAFLKEIAPKKAGSVVFSHNDLHSQNILEIEKHSKYILIDFEYSDYNFRGYDIANIFNEAMFEYGTDQPPFYTVDESNFPSDDNLREFIRYYLFFFKFNKDDFDLESILKHDSYLQEYIQKEHDFDSFLKEVEEIFHEVKICTLFSHYFWILWSVVKSKEGGFEFDHLHYAAKRLQIYRKLKEELPIEKKNGKESQDSSIP